MAGIEGIKKIGVGEENQQNPIKPLNPQNIKKKWTEELAAGLTGFQNTVNYVKNGGNVFQQSTDRAATSL